MKSLPISYRKKEVEQNKPYKVLFFCGILSSLYYVALNIVVPMHFPGYSSVSQTVSELSAIGAPTRWLWVLLCTFYSLLVMAFGWGIRQSALGNRHLRIVGTLMLVYGVSGFFWPPMHQREVLAAGGGTLTDTLHIVFAMVTVFLMMCMIGFGAAAFKKQFRLYSILTLVTLSFFGALTGMDGPHVGANLPTPLIGVWERINIGVFLLWVVVLAIMLLQAESEQHEVTAKKPAAVTREERPQSEAPQFP